MPENRQFISSYFAVIDRYVLKEFVINLLAVISVLWLIFVATRFARYLAQAAVGNLPNDVIFNLLGYSSLSALDILLPMATFMAVMLGLGRMNSDNELTVMFACGIPNKRLIRNVIFFSGTLAIVIAFLSLFIVPNALSGRYEVEQKARLSADTTGLIAGSFKEGKKGDWTFYSEELSDDKQELLNVFIEIDKEKPLVFRAEKGRFEIDDSTGDKHLVLINGYRYEGQAGEQDLTITQYGTHSLLIEKGQEFQVREKHKSLPSELLWSRATNRDLAELQWRIASPIMTVILSLYAMVFANAGPRKGRYAGLFPAVLVYIIYSNLLGVSRAWIAKDIVSPIVGTVWVHLLMLGLLLILVNRQNIGRWLTSASGGK